MRQNVCCCAQSYRLKTSQHACHQHLSLPIPWQSCGTWQCFRPVWNSRRTSGSPHETWLPWVCAVAGRVWFLLRSNQISLCERALSRSANPRRQDHLVQRASSSLLALEWLLISRESIRAWANLWRLLRCPPWCRPKHIQRNSGNPKGVLEPIEFLKSLSSQFRCCERPGFRHVGTMPATCFHASPVVLKRSWKAWWTIWKAWRHARCVVQGHVLWPTAWPHSSQNLVALWVDRPPWAPSRKQLHLPKHFVKIG